MLAKELVLAEELVLEEELVLAEELVLEERCSIPFALTRDERAVHQAGGNPWRVPFSRSP